MALPREPKASPAQRVALGEEEQGSRRSFRRQAETERSGLCDDEGGGNDVSKLDNALASVDDFVQAKLGL